MGRALVVALLVACGGNDGPRLLHDAAPVDAWRGSCDPVTQEPCAEGDKCEWIIDRTTPTVEGRSVCVPAGTTPVGEGCTYGVGVTDSCVRGAFCDRYSASLAGTGVCRVACSLQNGSCPAGTGCVAHSGYFTPPPMQPQVIGLCGPTCDPLADNDFDSIAPDLMRTGSGCARAGDGCYGSPSAGTPPVTQFTCVIDAGGGVRFHRSLQSGSVFANSCSQGYIPFLFESTGSTTIACIAFCKPVNCYSGNCGSNDENQLGQAPHRCNPIDRRGDFDTSATGEHCQFLWYWEIDQATRTHLPSPFSDTLGICFDHSKYLYDSNGDTVRDAPYPPCAQLQDGTGSGSNAADPLTYFGAANLGCVDSTRLPLMANGKRQFVGQLPLVDMRPLYTGGLATRPAE